MKASLAGLDVGTTLENPETDAKFKIVAKGRMLRVPPKFAEILTGALEEAVDAHTIQPYYTILLADECGMELKFIPSEGEIAFTAEVI